MGSVHNQSRTHAHNTRNPPPHSGRRWKEWVESQYEAVSPSSPLPQPNCYSRIITVDGKKKIMIFAMRR